jgi:protein TonB
MNSLLYALNIGTLATWLTVSAASTVATLVRVEERLPERNAADDGVSELFMTPQAMGSAPPAESPAAADDAVVSEQPEVTDEVVAELPETPELAAIPDLAEMEPLPEIPDLPVAPKVEPDARPKPAARAAGTQPKQGRTSTAGRSASSGESGRGSGRGNGSARGAGSSEVGSDRWLGLRKASPVYPAAAKRQGQQGRVVVQFTVDERGNVVDARVTGPSPYPLLNQEALRTIRRFKAKPGVRATTSQPIIFQLH